ncbi:MAG TPA: hypothetical protein VF334_19790 [Polyangia bacterium]
MAGLVASLTQIPFLVSTLVLAGFALWGWRRSAATGALLIAIACGVRVLGQLVSVYQMAQLGRVSAAEYGRMAMLFGLFHSAGALIADVLFIVGLALILRRLPARAR